MKKSEVARVLKGGSANRGATLVRGKWKVVSFDLHETPTYMVAGMK